MKSIKYHLEELVKLHAELQFLCSESRTKSSNLRIREIINEIGRRLQIVDISAIEFNIGPGGSKKEG